MVSLVPDDLGDDEVEQLLGEAGVELGALGELPQPDDLARLTGRVGRRQPVGGLEVADLLGAFEALGEHMDHGRVDVVDAVTQPGQLVEDGRVDPLGVSRRRRPPGGVVAHAVRHASRDYFFSGLGSSPGRPRPALRGASVCAPRRYGLRSEPLGLRLPPPGGGPSPRGALCPGRSRPWAPDRPDPCGGFRNRPSRGRKGAGRSWWRAAPEAVSPPWRSRLGGGRFHFRADFPAAGTGQSRSGPSNSGQGRSGLGSAA
ncbi:hypothetical protein SANTM175S_09681 [Streptomyces antimycoticus]